MSHILTLGSGATQPRLEIRNFVRNDKHFSLYVQALQRMYDDSESNLPSFFQVAGIHGLPFVAYDGAAISPPVNPATQSAGYCTHGSTLFPTWHRPYVMLIEQIIHGYAQQIAATYTTDKSGWQQAASALRQPYWDWAANAVPPDEVIALDQVPITAPNGSRISVTNPLRRYTFHQTESFLPAPYIRWKTTLRQPTSQRADATDNVSRLKSVLSNAQGNIRSSTYNLLTRVKTWPAFASHTVEDGGSATSSVEAIHDNIHVFVGGNGDMSDPSVAAFDPIFFMHHANVDRMLSLWSAVNPGVWTTPGDAEGGSFTLRAQQPVDQNTALTPFWRTQSAFWTSNQVRDTRTLGYTYPEFAGVNMDNPTALRTAILNAVNRLYGSGVGRITRRETDESGTIADSSKPLGGLLAVAGASDSIPPAHGRRHARTARAHHGSSSLQTRAEQVANQTYHDWSACVQFKRYELGGSFSILLFLGQVPENPEDWLVSKYMVGAHNAFVNSMECPMCARRDDMYEQAFIPLNPGIAANSGLDSYDPSVVTSYLAQQLSWRVQKTDGTTADLQSLNITIVDVPMVKTPSDIVPVASGPPRGHHNITQGRRH